MTSKLKILFVVILLIVLLSCSPPPDSTQSPISPSPNLPSISPSHTLTPISPSPTPIPSLSGRVTNVGGLGIAGATVEVWSNSIYQAIHSTPSWAVGQVKGSYSTTTVIDGSYAFFDLPEDDYVVRAFAPGYAREYFDNASLSSGAEIIRIIRLGDTHRVDFNLTEGSSISGRIYESDGNTPVVGAEIHVLPSHYPLDQGFWTKTDLDGSYKIENLFFGSFKVATRNQSDYKWYDGISGWNNFDNASQIIVTPPEDTSGIDIKLDLYGSISGFVFASDGVTPIAGVSVGANSDRGYCSSATSGMDGSYSMEGVIADDKYRVMAFDSNNRYATEFYNNRSSSGTAALIVVNPGNNTSNINFTLDEGGFITGHVYDARTGDPVHGIIIAFTLPGSFDSVSQPIETSYDGSYKVVVRPGKYIVATGRGTIDLRGYDYYPEWYNNAFDISNATLVTVTLHQEISGINFYLSRTGSISGYVYDKDGNPISGARIYAFSDIHIGNGANTADDGSYTIEGLLPGQYIIQVAVSGFVSEYFNDVAETSMAMPVIVIETENTPGVDFHLARQAP